MLQRLTSDDIAKWWNLIEKGIIDSLPPTALAAEDSMSNILIALTNGSMQCWIKLDEVEHRILGMLITAIMVEQFSGTKNLLLFSFYSNGVSTPREWRDSINAIKMFAKSKNCYKVISFTTKEVIESIVKKLGGRVLYSLVEFDLDQVENIGD